jgi:uncharacterized protein YegJ (DUF2314 family)
MRAMRVFGPRAAFAAFSAAALVTALAAACSSPKKSSAQVVAPPDAGPDAAVAQVALGPVRLERVRHALGHYFTPAPRVDPKTALATTCAAKAKAFTRVESIAEVLDATGTTFYPSRIPEGEPPPDPEFLEHLGEGLSPEQIAAIQKSEPGVTIAFAAPAAARWPALRAAYELVDCLAEATGGVVLDASTRQVFALAAFRQQRLGDWKGGEGVLDAHYNAHYYQDGESFRGVTVGLDRFGLPDLVVNDFVHATGPSVSRVVALVAAALDRPGGLVDGGFVDIDLDAPWAAAILADDKPAAGAARKARFRLVEARHEDGDAENRLWEITFDGFAGADVHERQSAAMAQLFGREDTAVPSDNSDEAMKAASARARARLPAVKQRFVAGLPTGQRLLVKAPFDLPDDGGHEYMWIEVTRWKGDELTGTLVNEPDRIPGLHEGATVKVAQRDVFDYSVLHADGTSEGDETSKVLEQQGQKRPE